MAVIPLSNEEFNLIRRLMYRQFGINLSEQKKTLVVERLQKILLEQGIPSFKAYYDHVISDASGKALLQLVDLLSTNHTFFFREEKHFEFLCQGILPQLRKKQQGDKQPSLRIWSAGCASGEEAYSIAMVLKDYFGEEAERWDIGVLATDIAESALAKARAAVYPESQLHDVAPHYRKRYFRKSGDGLWALSPDIQKMILFRRLNLMQADFPFKKQFHVIFCRNVMIYFDEPTRMHLIEKFHRYIKPEGYLFIGHSETLNRDQSLFRYVEPAIYQKVI